MTMPKTEETTDILDSALFFRVEDEDTHVDVQIYRLEEQDLWTLELVNAEGVSTVWDDEFSYRRCCSTSSSGYHRGKRTGKANDALSFLLTSPI